METLVINIPDSKSALVKKMLKEFGVTIEPEKKAVKKHDLSAYKKRILEVGVWSEEDVRPILDAGKAFNDLKPEQW